MTGPPSSTSPRQASGGDAMVRLKVLFWLQLGRRERALRVIERALQDGAHGSLHRHRAQLLRLVGRREESAEAYRASLRFDPLDGALRIEAVEALISWGWDKDRIQAFMEEFAETGLDTP